MANPKIRTRSPKGQEHERDPLTIAGNLVDDPELRFTPAGQPVAKFRVAATPRSFDNSIGELEGRRQAVLTASCGARLLRTSLRA